MVTLVSKVHDEKGHAFFSYITSLKHLVNTVPPMIDLCTSQSRSRSWDCL